MSGFAKLQAMWGEWHADHINPNSHGGKTTVANGQIGCPSCNLAKRNKID